MASPRKCELGQRSPWTPAPQMEVFKTLGEALAFWLGGGFATMLGVGYGLVYLLYRMGWN